MFENWGRLTRITLIAGSLALLLGSVSRANAQAVFGQIVGTVTDSTGAAIPDADITVTDKNKGTSVNLKSNGAGEFAAPHLIPDIYNIKVSANGFKSFEQTDLQVYADTAPKVSVTLTAGSADQTVEVNADSVPQLKTDRADVATIFNAQQVEDLPIPGQNFTNLQLLLPGAQQLGWSHATDENPQGSKQIQVDGQAFGGVSYMLDGTDNQDPILGIIVINPNLDSLSEAKITTQNFDAEFGKAVASFITVQTKSGTNSFHGSAFDNRQSNANLARDPFTQGPSQLSVFAPFPGGLMNQFGGSLGGPIIKDKIFFFADYQGVRQKVGISQLQTVPSAHLVSTCLGTAAPYTGGVAGCDFSEYVAAGYQIYDNSASAANGGAPIPGRTISPYANGVIPAAQLSPQALGLFKLLQPYAPNAPGSVPNPVNPQYGLSNNYAASGSGLFNTDQWDVRGDATLNQKMHVFGRFSRFTDTETGATMFGPAGGSGFGLGGYGGSSTGANDSLALGLDVAVNPTLVSDVRLGYYRYNILTAKYNQGTNFATNLGIPGENLGSSITSGAPDFNIADLNVTSANAGPNNAAGAGSQYGAGLNVNRCNCPLIEREDQFQFVNNWTKTIGNHAVKFGIDLRYARNLRVPSDNDRAGVNQFGPGPTSNGAIGGLGFATFVLGDVTAYNRYVSVSTNAKEFQKRDFGYIQDTWRATPKLTLNIGVRYEAYFPETVNGPGNGALLDLSTGYIHVAGIGGVPSNMGVGIGGNAYNPRLGVAYQFNEKTVIRAGYGRSFDLGVFGSEFGHVVTQNIPVLANQSINATQGTTSFPVNLRTGPPAYVFPTVPSNGLLLNPGSQVNTKARPFTMRLPTLDAWNLSVQRSLTPTISVTAAYIGNKGSHTLSAGDTNTTNPNEPGIFLPAQYTLNGQALHYDPAFPNAPSNTGGTGNTTLLRRYNNGTLPACPGACGWTQDISYYGDNQDSHYNSIQISVAKEYTHGNSVNVNYAYQRATNYASSYATWNRASTFGPDDSIRRSQITGYGLFSLPVGRNQLLLSHANGLVNALVGGFQFSPVVVYSSGLPYTLSYNECGNDIPSSAPCYVNGSASALHSGATGVPGVNLTFFKRQTLGGAFTDPGLDTIGNAGRNSAWGPNFFNSDMSLLKNFTIKERYTAQLRMDAFNAFNHINFNLPNGTVDNPSAGQITSGPYPGGSANPRQLQFTARIQF